MSTEQLAMAVRPRRQATPQRVFDNVAPFYDALNSTLSLGLDRWWRRRVAQSLSLGPDATVLDVATGTGALARAIWRHSPRGTRIIGVDLNVRMLETARKKTQKSAPLNYVRCPAERLPFADDQFDAVTMAMAIDDLADRRGGAMEMRRVLKPGGELVIMELSLPQNRFMLGLYRAYLGLFPLFDKIVRSKTYSHLKHEIQNYKGREALEALMADIGLRDYRRRELCGGIATIHIGKKAP